MTDYLIDKAMERTWAICGHARCNKCDMPVLWVVTKAKKNMAIDMDPALIGQCHFATCPYSEKAEKPNAAPVQEAYAGYKEFDPNVDDGVPF